MIVNAVLTDVLSLDKLSCYGHGPGAPIAGRCYYWPPLAPMGIQFLACRINEIRPFTTYMVHLVHQSLLALTMKVFSIHFPSFLS